MAETTATPSMVLGVEFVGVGARSWCFIRWTFDALTPPIHTVPTFLSASLP